VAEIGGVALSFELVSSVNYLLLVPFVGLAVWLVLWRVKFESMERTFGLMGLAMGGALAFLTRAPEERPAPKVVVTKSNVKESVGIGTVEPMQPVLEVGTRDPPMLEHRWPTTLKPRPGERISVEVKLCASESGRVTGVAVQTGSGSLDGFQISLFHETVLCSLARRPGLWTRCSLARRPGL